MHKITNKTKKKKIREIPAIIRSKKARISLAIKFILITLRNSKSYKFYIKLKEEITLSVQKEKSTTQIKNNIQKQVLLKKRFFFLLSMTIIIFKFLRLIGIEPITFGTEIQHSIQLSYKRRHIQKNTI